MCVQPLAKSLQQVGADEPAILRRDAVAAAGVRRDVGAGLDFPDREVVIDCHAHPQVVDRLARTTHAGEQRDVVVLHVVEMAFDVEEAVGAPIALVDHLSRMESLAGRGRSGQRHRMREESRNRQLRDGSYNRREAVDFR